MNSTLNVASNSSDESSYCSMFDDDCDNEMNKWFQLFFHNVDQAVFFDQKLSQNYEKIDKECKVWNKLFKLKNVDLENPELQRTIFTSEKLGKNKPQLLEEVSCTEAKHLLFRNKDKPTTSLDEDELKQPNRAVISKRSNGSKMRNQLFEMNDKFDQITLMNQIKQDYIRKHVLNSTKSDYKSDYHAIMFGSNQPLNSNRKKKVTIEQKKLNEDTESGCLFFYPRRKKENKRAKEDKTKVRTIHSIIQIDKGNSSNLILNSEQLIQTPRLKKPLILPPVYKGDLTRRFDKITLHDQKEAILNCDKSLNQYSFNLRKSQELRASAFRRPVMLVEDNE